jgi:hypothetical protein
MTSRPQMAQAEQGLSEHMRRCIQLCSDCHNICALSLARCVAMGGAIAEEKHLRLIMDCAQICQTSADFMLRGSSFHGRVCGVCADVCESCADSCESFSDDAQMRLCAELCRECATTCREMSVAE